MIIDFANFIVNIEKYFKLAQLEDIIIKKGEITFDLSPYNENNYKVREKESLAKNKEIKINYEEYKKIVKNSNNRYEYIAGRIYLLASPGYRHQKVVKKLLLEIDSYLEDSECEVLTAPFDIKIYRGDEINVVQPDLLVICDIDKIDKNERYQGKPEIVIEVLSESTKNIDLIKKLDLYRSGKIKEYWIVNPFNNEIMIYKFSNKAIEEIKSYKKSELLESKVLKEINILVRNIFK